MTLADDKRVVVYMGDDQVSEYIYKFVSDGKYDPARPALNRLLLDKGTLYVARFLDGAAQGDAMGVGEWIALKLDTPALAGGTLGALFNQDMGELLVKTRQAADAVGATPMDRPEWITTHPTTREAYVTLTNNSSRGTGGTRYPNGRSIRAPTTPTPYRQPVRPDRALAREERRSGVADVRMGHLRAGGQPDAVPAHRPAQWLGQRHHGQHFQQPRRPGLRQARPAVDRD